MARVHIVNVFPGDCSIIQHNSGRVTMVDICDGNAETTRKAVFKGEAAGATGNFRMCDCNTNPIEYCKSLGIKRLWRFVLSHPDMDHMDGFNRLVDQIGIDNFWDSGARREKPPFEGGQYFEDDWDRYVKVRDGQESGVTVLRKVAGDSFQFANDAPEGQGHDGLHILAPTSELLNDPDLDNDVNEGSYVVNYQSNGGRILLCGDAHDAAFGHIKRNYRQSVEGAAILLAPHHGRDSGRSYEFLDFIRPKLTVIGCAPSEYIDYAQWSRRGLDMITSNQAGNIVLDIGDGFIDVFIENKRFAVATHGTQLATNDMGYHWWKRVKE